MAALLGLSSLTTEIALSAADKSPKAKLHLAIRIYPCNKRMCTSTKHTNNRIIGEDGNSSP